jgi:hypothetical protein
MAFEPGANGTITLNGDLTSNGGNVQAFGPVIVGQRINAIDVTGAGGDGTLTFSSALTSAGTGSGLLFKAGSGSIEFDGQVGTSAARIDNIEIVSAQSTAFQADLYTGHLQQDAGGKQLLFLGNVDAETNQTEAANLTGTDIELNPNKTFFAYGDVTIDVGATGTLDLFGGSRIVVGNGTFTQNGTGVVYLGGQVVTSGGNINFDGAVQVMNDSVKVCSTGSSCATSFPSGGGNIAFNNSVDTVSGDPAHNFQISANEAVSIAVAGQRGDGFGRQHFHHQFDRDRPGHAGRGRHERD